MIYSEQCSLAITPEKLSRQIEQFFDVHTEWRTIQDQLRNGVAVDDIIFYGRESFIKFILEFAAAIPQTSITYQIKSDGIYFPGIAHPVRTMFENSAVFAGPGSREEADFLGWQEAERMTQEGCRSFMLVSPPSVQPNGKFVHGFGKYGFLFYFTRDEWGRLKNTILRYNENNKLSTSRLLAYSIGFSPFEQEGANGYVRAPQDVTNLDEHSLERILQYVGYDKNSVQSQQLEQQLLSDDDFCKLFQQYIVALIQPIPNFALMKRLITQLYNRAYFMIETPYPPPVFSGGSCPVTGGGFEFFIPRYSDASEFYDVKVTRCPSCERRCLIDKKQAKKRKISCPHCDNSTTCPEGIYTGAASASSYEKEVLSFVEDFD